MSVEKRLASTRFTPDEQSHIELHPDAPGFSAALIRISAACPAKVYRPRPDGGADVEHAACLECGTCVALATPGTLTWHQPRGGLGVSYRHG